MNTRILERALDERQFLSRYGVRSVSRIHAERSNYKRIGEPEDIGRAAASLASDRSSPRRWRTRPRRCAARSGPAICGAP